MFGRGNWAVFGIKATTQAAFEKNLNDPQVAQDVSQAHALTDIGDVENFGINGFACPRGDEATDVVNAATEFCTTEDFRLGPQQFGLWFCLNAHEDVTDPKSKQEAVAYDSVTKPFKFLNKEEKKMVEDRVEASAVVARAQFPVLIDFVGERVYALTTDVEQIGSLRVLLERLGAELRHLSGQFGGLP